MNGLHTSHDMKLCKGAALSLARTERHSTHQHTTYTEGKPPLLYTRKRVPETPRQTILGGASHDSSKRVDPIDARKAGNDWTGCSIRRHACPTCAESSTMRFSRLFLIIDPARHRNSDWVKLNPARALDTRHLRPMREKNPYLSGRTSLSSTSPRKAELPGTR